MRKPKKTSDAVAILRRHIDRDPGLRAVVAEERMNREIAELIRAAREAEGLSQEELAGRLRTSQSTIARLENPDYGGHTLRMLARILASLNRDLEVRAPRKVAGA